MPKLNHIACICIDAHVVAQFYSTIFDMSIDRAASFNGSPATVRDGYVGFNFNSTMPGRPGPVGLDHFGIDDEDPRVNPYGGAIAVGHPLAASGVRLMIQLAHQFEAHPEVRYGLTAMCVGLGQGGSVIWENPHFTGGR